jgi:serine/threonine-protein phosphatase PGAM5
MAYRQFARRLVVSGPAAVAAVALPTFGNDRNTNCENAAPAPAPAAPSVAKKPTSHHHHHRHSHVAGMVKDAEGDFHGLFPKRQLWQPALEYPLWDSNWDGKKPQSTGDPEQDKQMMRKIRKEGVTKHIVLVRHGQYDETHKEDDKRLLTPLGREQAAYTGKRLKEMLDGFNKEFGPCKIKVVRVSNMARAKETADIIASHLPGVEYAQGDEDLNEGRPCHTIPGGKASEGTIQKTDENHKRIERAFQRYFYRADLPDLKGDGDGEEKKEDGVEEDPSSKHEFEVIVCHANGTFVSASVRISISLLLLVLFSHSQKSSGTFSAEHCNCHPRHGCACAPSTAP